MSRGDYNQFGDKKMILVSGVRCAVFSLMLVAIASFPSFSWGAPTVGRNFAGDTINQSNFIPPDTMGAVGPNHIVELINGRYSAYNKTTGANVQTSTLNAFWTAAGAAPTSNSFDPRVLYDPFSSRWYACAVDNGGAANNFLVAVSTTDDPTGTWAGFKIDSDTNNGEWADYPTLGINNDVVVITANMFTIGGSFHSITVLVLPKAGLTAVTPTVAARTLFENVSANNLGFTVQPAVDMDNGSLPLPMFATFNKASGTMMVSSIGGTALAPTIVNGTIVNVTARGAPPTLDQPGAKQNVDSGDSRLNGNVFLQQITGRASKTLWAAHAVNIGGRSGIEWYEINPTTATVIQSGTLSDGTMAYIYPTIAVNDSGDVVIGCSGGSPSTFVGAYAFTGSTTAGSTTLATTPLLLQAGASDYAVTFGGSRNRWGDYSATMVDPSDQTRFWCVQEYVSATDIWAIRMTEIIFTTGPPPTGEEWVLDWPAPDTIWTLGVDGNFTYSGGMHDYTWGPVQPLFWFYSGINSGPVVTDGVTRTGSAIIVGDEFFGTFVEFGVLPVIRVTGARMTAKPLFRLTSGEQRESKRLNRNPPRVITAEAAIPLQMSTGPATTKDDVVPPLRRRSKR